jgi:hypothetical protein
LKFGVFLYQPEPVEGVDYNFYRQKSESGIVGKANPQMYTNIAVFGDNNMAAKRPDGCLQAHLSSTPYKQTL